MLKEFKALKQHSLLQSFFIVCFGFLWVFYLFLFFAFFPVWLLSPYSKKCTFAQPFQKTKDSVWLEQELLVIKDFFLPCALDKGH